MPQAHGARLPPDSSGQIPRRDEQTRRPIDFECDRVAEVPEFLHTSSFVRTGVLTYVNGIRYSTCNSGSFTILTVRRSHDGVRDTARCQPTLGHGVVLDWLEV